MPITFRFYEQAEDIDLQYDFWINATATLPYAWKPTLSPKLYAKQAEFHTNSRCFAFKNNELIGYMSFTGKGDFISLGYPWTLPAYKGELQDELFDRVHQFAISDECGGKTLAQRFRSQWEEPIQYFLDKGFRITNQSPIVGKKLNDMQRASYNDFEFSYEIRNEFEFENWRTIKRMNNEGNLDQLEMMREYYSSVDFDFSLRCIKNAQDIAYFGVTIRPDTAFSEILAVGVTKDAAQYVKQMVEIIQNECFIRGASVIAVGQSELPDSLQLKELGYEKLTEDVMMMKNV